MVINRLARTKGLFDAIVTFATGVAAVLLIWRLAFAPEGGGSASRLPQFEDIASSRLTARMTGSPTRGSASSPLVMIEFSDFECPFCARFARETFDRLERDFIQRGQIEYAVKSFPLRHMHPHAQAAAQSAWCAQAQGRFWEMRRTLFAQRSLAGASWNDMAIEIGLDVNRFEECLTRRPRKNVGVEVTPSLAPSSASASILEILSGAVEKVGS